MRLLNETKNRTITDNLIFLKTLSEKSKGLLHEKTPKPVYLQTRWGIHTFGMKFKIDCIVADKNMVVKKTKSMKPNQVFFWNPKYNNIFEMPSGTINKYKIQVGDRLKIEKTAEDS